MYSCQYNAVATDAVCQPDSFIFSDVRLHGDRKQTAWILVLHKPDHHLYRVNGVNINGVFQYPRYGFLSHGICRVMPVFRTIWQSSIPDRLAEPPKQAAEILENSNQDRSR